MPKIINYSSILNEEQKYSLYSNPIDWNWNSYTLYDVKTINKYVIAGDFNDPKYIQYGIFKNSSDLNSCVSAIAITIEPGLNYNLNINTVAIINNVTTIESERKNGLATILYDYILNTHKCIISDNKLFTDKNKINKSLGIWSNYLSKISKVSNFNIKTKEYSKFDIISGNDENIKFVAINI